MSTLDRFTASRSKVRVVLGCLAAGLLAGLVAGVARAPANPETPVASAPAWDEESTPAPDADADAETPDRPPGAGAEEPGPVSAAAEEEAVEADVTEAEVVEAHQAAADFAGAYATYRYDDGPAALVERVRDFSTPELAAELARNSGATAAREELEERREIAAGSAFTVQTDTVGAGYVDVLVLVRQEVTSSESAATKWPSYLLRVARTEAGWRVSALLR